MGGNKGAVPHIPGADFRRACGIEDGSPSHYALIPGGFSALAQAYGRFGGLDRVATVIDAIPADRPDAIRLDGGDTWHRSNSCHATKGRNIDDAEWDEPTDPLPPYQMVERGGTGVAVIGQAVPYMPITNPGWMFPEHSFGIRDENAATIEAKRAPHLDYLQTEVGVPESLLHRRGNFDGTWDDLICDALLSERVAESALSPGVRWGPSLIPGQAITREDIWNLTSMSHGQAYRTEMTGEFLKVVMKDLADNIFNPYPYY